MILSKEEALPYLNKVRSMPWKLKHAFRWENYSKEYIPKFEDFETSDIQVFSFPRNRTVFCFSELTYSGAIIFKTGTDSIINVWPWSEKIKDELDKPFRKHFSIDLLYYQFQYSTDHRGNWELHILAVTAIDGIYHFWRLGFNVNDDYLYGIPLEMRHGS